MADLEIFISYDESHETPFQEKESVVNDKVAVINPIQLDDEEEEEEEEEDLPAYMEEEENNNITISTDNQQFTDNDDNDPDTIQEEEGPMSPLEKLLHFSDSPLVLQRLVVTKDLVSIIQSITLQEAVLVALPIILQLAKDNDESIRESLSMDLDKIINYYYQNAPPLLLSDDEDRLAIPKHAFVLLIIEFLLDQNTTLASLAQQSVVTVATELAKTPKHDKNYALHNALLEEEIYKGVVLGLLEMFNNTPEENENYDDGSANLAKMVCLMLISALALEFNAGYCTEKFLPIVESMASDTMFYVRKEAATAVGSLAASVEPNITLERLLPLYQTLSTDTIWHVRRACIFSLPLLCQTLPLDKKSTVAVDSIDLFKTDVSRNVRNSLADILGELISKFLPDNWQETNAHGQLPEPLLDFYLSLSDKSDTDRIYNFAYNFPAVLITCGAEYWDSHLQEPYLHLTKDYQLRVRRTFACSLHQVARIIGPERTERDLIQIFALYLMDVDDVKEGVLEHLSEFLGVLKEESRNEYIPILAEVWDGVLNNWYLRDVLTSQLRDIARLFDASRVVEHVFPLAIRACQDEFAAIRESGVEIVPVILDIVKQTVDQDGENLSQCDFDDGFDTEEEKRKKFAEALLTHVMEKLDSLVKSNNYRTRLIFAHICGSLLEAGISPPDFASFFLSRLVVLSKDPVVNVRIATSRVINTLCAIDGYTRDLQAITLPEDTMLEQEPSQVLEDIFYHLSTDTDKDVRYFVEPHISSEKLESFEKRKQEESLAPVEEIDPHLPMSLDHLTVFFSTLANLDDEDEDEEEKVMNSPIIADMEYEEDADYRKESDNMFKDDDLKDTLLNSPISNIAPIHS